MTERRGAGGEFKIGMMAQPGEAFFMIARAEFSKQFAEAALKGFLDAGHMNKSNSLPQDTGGEVAKMQRGDEGPMPIAPEGPAVTKIGW